ncbi:phosphodiester glycosidase family protein [Lusitaniella coriacea]|uniref:phosphodiester glycosidase family protein n=1 Tax=Lusitaniella coriacea TaxID=1983105 RepID=UPI003CF6D6FF
MANDSTPVFPDVTNHWAKEFIQALRSRNIVSGFPNGSFRPDKIMNRAEYAAILEPSFRRPSAREYVPFVDFSPHYWAAGSIRRAYETGFLSGFPNRRFRPLDPVARVQVLVSLVNGLRLGAALKSDAIVLSEVYEDAGEIPSYAVQSVEIATRAGIVVNHPDLKRLNPNQGATRAEVAAFIYQALVFLGKVPVIDSEYILTWSSPVLLNQGTKISLNGRTRTAQWGQWRRGASLRTGIRDVDLQNVLGVELLNSSDPKVQPIRWFADTAVDLGMRMEGRDRVLDVTDLAFRENWQIQGDETTLSLTLPASKLENITFEEQPTGANLILDLDRPTTWQLRQQDGNWILSLDSDAEQELIDRFQTGSVPQPTPDNTEEQNEGETSGSDEKPNPPIAERKNGQIVLTGNLPDGLGVKVTSSRGQSYQLRVELRPDALVDRDIAWMKGLRWQQQYLNLGDARFPVTWLTLNLQEPSFRLRPIWTNSSTMTGTEPLLTMARKWEVFAAINGGFFNRITRFPLGAIRWQNEWLSGPILNRGAIAWNDMGEVEMDRLTLNETLKTQFGKEFPILFLNSGYYRAGIARYTPAWGSTYTPFIDDEVAIAVENNRIIRHHNGGAAGSGAIAIPENGYLLVLRANASVVASLDVGSTVEIEQSTTPSHLETFPHLLAAGPLLLKNGQEVLDAAAEGFGSFFLKQTAIRSILGKTAEGKIIIATIHNRVGGRGPTLPETVQLAGQIGMVDALNLDGGSSTSLYLGGQLLNRPPSTAARVHNGLALVSSEL